MAEAAAKTPKPPAARAQIIGWAAKRSKRKEKAARGGLGVIDRGAIVARGAGSRAQKTMMVPAQVSAPQVTMPMPMCTVLSAWRVP